VEIEYALLADGVAPRPDGKMDIFGAGVDTIWAASAPAQHSQISLVLAVSLARHEAENPHHIDVIVQDADGEEIVRAQGDIPALDAAQLDAMPAGRRLIIRPVLTFGGLTLPHFGMYQFVVMWDGNEARSPILLGVSEMPPPQGV
jgi:hypothetical protein